MTEMPGGMLLPSGMHGRGGRPRNGPLRVTLKLQIAGQCTVEMVVLGLGGIPLMVASAQVAGSLPWMVLQLYPQARQRRKARPRMLGAPARIVPRTQPRLVPKVGPDVDCPSLLSETPA